MDPNIWRPRIKRAAWGAILLSLVALWYGYSAGSYISAEPFLFILAGTFLLVLGVSHLIYAEWESVPLLVVRLIDYVYIGFGTVGAFLAFAIQGQHEREIYLRALLQARTSTYAMSLPVSATPENLEKYIAGTIEDFCINKSQAEILKGRPFRRHDINSDLPAALRRGLTKEFCDWAKHLRAFAANKFSMSDLENEVAGAREKNLFSSLSDCEAAYGNMPKFRAPSKSPFELKALPRPFRQQMIYTRLCWVDLEAEKIVGVLQVILEKMKLAMPLPPLPPERPDSTGFGIFKTVEWPFLLAIAFALRLTKVTAEVTAWAK